MILPNKIKFIIISKEPERYKLKLNKIIKEQITTLKYSYVKEQTVGR